MKFPRPDALLLAFLMATLAACQTQDAQIDKTAATDTAVERGPEVELLFADEESGYYEFAHDGRIYVAGSKESAGDFTRDGHLPYVRTVLGAGPQGETVIFEIDSDDEDLDHRLENQFASRVRVVSEDPAGGYWEFLKDGRFYIVGSEASAEKFTKSAHLPLTKTILGAGPQGQTVVFEVDPADAGLEERLQSQWASRSTR